MNKFLLFVLSLSFCSGVFAQDPDAQGPRYKFGGMSFKLDPYQQTIARETDDKSGDEVIKYNLPLNLDLAPLQSSVKNQGERGSCAFFTSAALLESLVKQKQGLEIDISEEYLIWKVKGELGLNSKTDGSLAHQNVLGIVVGGILLERDLPFGPSWFSFKLPCASYDENSQNTPVSCFSHNKPDAETLSKVISAKSFVPSVFPVSIANIIDRMGNLNQPVIIGVPVHPKGWDEKTGEAILTDAMIVECNAKPSLCGGHSILLTGYDSIKGVFTFKNSWGESWGNKGYGRISFPYVARFARDRVVSGSLKDPLDIPSNFAEKVLPSATVENVTVKLDDGIMGKYLSISYGVHAQNFDYNTFYTSAFIVTVKDEKQEISDDNSNLIPTMKDYKKRYSDNVKDGFTRIFGKDGNDALMFPSLQILEKALDRTSIQGKDLYLRISTYYYSTVGDGWVKMSREYKKIDFAF